jgi:hypothetical protein
MTALVPCLLERFTIATAPLEGAFRTVLEAYASGAVGAERGEADPVRRTLVLAVQTRAIECNVPFALEGAASFLTEGSEEPTAEGALTALAREALGWWPGDEGGWNAWAPRVRGFSRGELLAQAKYSRGDPAPSEPGRRRVPFLSRLAFEVVDHCARELVHAGVLNWNGGA